MNYLQRIAEISVDIEVTRGNFLLFGYSVSEHARLSEHIERINGLYDEVAPNESCREALSNLITEASKLRILMDTASQDLPLEAVV